jgi:hypothetical protein
METKITLRVLNVDLDDDETVECVAEHLSDLVWSVVDGVTRATVFTASPDVVDAVVTAARRIEHKLAESRVDEADEELVAIPDISARMKVHRETVRSWVGGTRGPGGFPLPVGSFGGGGRGSMKAWRWAEVNAWLDQNYSIGDGYLYPTRKQYAEINAYLGQVPYILAIGLPSVPQPDVIHVQYLEPRREPLVTFAAAGVPVRSVAPVILMPGAGS